MMFLKSKSTPYDTHKHSGWFIAHTPNMNMRTQQQEQGVGGGTPHFMHVSILGDRDARSTQSPVRLTTSSSNSSFGWWWNNAKYINVGWCLGGRWCAVQCTLGCKSRIVYVCECSFRLGGISYCADIVIFYLASRFVCFRTSLSALVPVLCHIVVGPLPAVNREKTNQIEHMSTHPTTGPHALKQL